MCANYQLLHSSPSSNAFCSSAPETFRSRGQTLLQVALINVILTVVGAIIVEQAIVGGADLRLFRLIHEGARYAAIDAGFTPGNISTDTISAAFPMIPTDSGMDIMSVSWSAFEVNFVNQLTLPRTMTWHFRHPFSRPGVSNHSSLGGRRDKSARRGSGLDTAKVGGGETK